MYYLAVEGGRAPRYAHPTVESAKQEAERLSKLLNKRVSVYQLLEVIAPELEGGKDAN